MLLITVSVASRKVQLHSVDAEAINSSVMIVNWKLTGGREEERPEESLCIAVTCVPVNHSSNMSLVQLVNW